MARPKISDEQKQKTLKLYRNKSLTLKEIANLCDVSEKFVVKIVRESVANGGIKRRSEFFSNLPKKAKFTDNELEQIAVDYYENKLSTFEIEQKWGCHRMQLQRVRNRFGARYGKKTMGGEFRVRTVQQFDKEGNFIAEYPNALQASVATGINYQTISRCCNGIYKTSGGFVWKLKENINEN